MTARTGTWRPRGQGARGRAGLARLLAVSAGLAGLVMTVSPASAQPGGDSAGDGASASTADYFAALEGMGLVDVDTGSREALREELAAAERLLRQGATMDAAVALYAIVESPRFTAFEDFVEYHNAEYDLAIALAAAGAYDSSLVYLERVLARGPGTIYFAPAHQRAVDVALETRDYQGVLARLQGIDSEEPLPAEAAAEQAYLAARLAYARGDRAAADQALGRIPAESRLRSSALYLQGVIRTRQGSFASAAQALCTVAETREDEARAFVVDGRYFTVKDLARLGLGRIAHERGEYDDAYYHYFQIPDDSDRLPEALFEAAWSMYQKRDLNASRDLLEELQRTFPTAPQTPEARLLAGYVELADCKFDAALVVYDDLIAWLQPVVDELARARKDPTRRRRLFDQALARWRAEDERAGRGGSGSDGSDGGGAGQGAEAAAQSADAPPSPDVVRDRLLGLLRLDPKFMRLHQAVRGMRRAAGDAPHAVRTWAGLGRQVTGTRVGAVASERTIEEEDAADANGLLEDVRRLREDVRRARAELRRGMRAGTIDKDTARAEQQRLQALGREVEALGRRAARAAADADAAIEREAAAELRPLLREDLARARALERASRQLLRRLEASADALARSALDRLYVDARRVLDKAKLGRIDAVIGQKRSLDIQVQDLAAGRYPAELRGRLWEEGLIGDDEEFWPFEGEYWADEYEGWR